MTRATLMTRRLVMVISQTILRKRKPSSIIVTTSVARLTLHVANKTSYEILLSSLPVGARSIIKLDRNQYINLLSVEKAYNKYQTKNLDILRCIVTDSRVVDFDATANSYTYKNPDGKIEEMTFTEPSRTNTYRELMDAFVGSEADKQSYSQILIQSGIKDEIEVTGNFGATSYLDICISIL